MAKERGDVKGIVNSGGRKKKRFVSVLLSQQTSASDWSHEICK